MEDSGLAIKKIYVMNPGRKKPPHVVIMRWFLSVLKILQFVLFEVKTALSRISQFSVLSIRLCHIHGFL